MPIAGGAGEAPVSNAWWRGWKWRPHRQHERTPAWSLYRRGHRPPASAIRADQDGADYPRRDRRAEIVERQRADRTTAQAPARCWSKARFGPLLALARLPLSQGGSAQKLERGSLENPIPTGDRGFESVALRRGVCKPPVPLGRGADPSGLGEVKFLARCRSI